MSRLFALSVAAALAAAPAAPAGFVTVGNYSGTGTNAASGHALAANALFEYDAAAQQLRVTLTNTALSDVTVPSDVLTGVFFGYGAPAPGLVRAGTTATIAPGSSLVVKSGGGLTVAGSQPAGGDVTGHYAFKAGVTYQGVAGLYGFSATGLGGTFGTPDVLGTGNPNTGGLNYGLLSAGDDLTTGNGGILNNAPYVKNSVRFLFPHVAAFDGSKLGPVKFQYGTSLTDPSLQGVPPTDRGPTTSPVPAPAGLVLALTAAPVLGLVRRWRAGA